MLASCMQMHCSCAGRWWLLHLCRWCATTLAVTTWKEPVRQQWLARCVLAAAAATAVQPARLLTGGGTGRAARPWRQQGWCASDCAVTLCHCEGAVTRVNQVAQLPGWFRVVCDESPVLCLSYMKLCLVTDNRLRTLGESDCLFIGFLSAAYRSLRHRRCAQVQQCASPRPLLP
jgi:hypothetical protein